MRLAIICLAAILFATSVIAQDDMAVRRAAAESFLKSPAQQRAIDAMFSTEQMVSMLRAQIPNATQQQIDTVAKIVSEELQAIRARMETVMLGSAVESFTTDELKAMDDFYRSPMGEAVMFKMPAFMQANMVAMAPDMQRMQANIGRRVREALAK